MKRGVESQSKRKESSKPQTQEGRREVSKRLLEVHFLELKATSQSKQKTIGLSSYSGTQNFMPILSIWTEVTLNSSLCRWVSPVTIHHPMFLLTILEVTNMHQSVRQTISIPIITAGNSAEFITAYQFWNQNDSPLHICPSPTTGLGLHSELGPTLKGDGQREPTSCSPNSTTSNCKAVSGHGSESDHHHCGDSDSLASTSTYTLVLISCLFP